MADTVYWTNRKNAALAMIEAHETAMQKALSSGIQWYQVDTGQTEQRVQRFNIQEGTTALNSLYNMYNNACARLGLSNNVYRGIPSC